MNKNLISIIVPVYNTSNYLRRCVDSILDQTYKNIEVILVNDGSKDDSGAICDELSQQNACVKVIHKENEGLGLARNTGIEYAHGDFITFIDSDDYIEKDHIENLYNGIISNMVDACYGGHTKVNTNGEIIYKNILSGEKFCDQSLLNYVVPRMCGQTGSRDDCIQMSVCMALYSRRVIESNNVRFVSERQYVSEDLLFNIDFLGFAKSVYFSDDVGYKYWFNENSLSHSYLPNRFYKSKVMMQEMKDRTKVLGIYDYCEQRIINTFLVNTRVSLQGENAHAKEADKEKAYKRFKTILYDPDLHRVFKVYKSEGVRSQARLINFLIRHKCCFALWNVMTIRNKYNI